MYLSLLQCDCFFNDTATTEIYTLSLHDALPIADAGDERGGANAAVDGGAADARPGARRAAGRAPASAGAGRGSVGRSEEHTSELQSRQYLVCRLLLEKKTFALASHKSLQYTLLL